MASNQFRKSFYTSSCVWLRMENIIFQKSISFDRKIKVLTRKLFYVSFFTSNHFRTQMHRERERERESLRLRTTKHAGEITPRSSRRDRATWSLSPLDRSRPPLGQIISSSRSISSSATRWSISFSRSILSPICFLSLISDFFFVGCGGVGGGVFVVSMLCGGGFCVDSGGFSVGAGVWVVVDFLWVLMCGW